MNPPKNKYFNYVIDTAAQLLPDIPLDFTGYDELIDELKTFEFSDTNRAWEISQKCNAWCEYISDIKAVIHQKLADAETDKKVIISLASSKADDKKVANGDRLANKDPDVVKIRKYRNFLEALLQLLEDKHQFLIQSHYFTKMTCDWSLKCTSNNTNK